MPPAPILIDNCALCDLFLGEPEFELAAQELRRNFGVWVAPPLLKYEFGNVLRTQAHVGRKTAEEAVALFSAGIALLNWCSEPAKDIVLEIAVNCGLSFYDATYVACARLHGISLYTRDKGILSKCPDVAILIPT